MALENQEEEIEDHKEALEDQLLKKNHLKQMFKNKLEKP